MDREKLYKQLFEEKKLYLENYKKATEEGNIYLQFKNMQELKEIDDSMQELRDYGVRAIEECNHVFLKVENKIRCLNGCGCNTDFFDASDLKSSAFQEYLMRKGFGVTRENPFEFYKRIFNFEETLIDRPDLDEKDIEELYIYLCQTNFIEPKNIVKSINEMSNEPLVLSREK